MFQNYKNYLFISDSSQKDVTVALQVLKFCVLERSKSSVTHFISLEKAKFSCAELATIPLDDLDNIIFTSFSGDVDAFRTQLMDIHNLKRKPHTIIFHASAESMSLILFAVSVIFSYVEFLPETVRSVVIIDRSIISNATLAKLSDLYYTEKYVITDFQKLKHDLLKI